MKCNECKDINECGINLSIDTCEKLIETRYCEKCKYKNNIPMVKPCIDCRGDVNYFEPMNNEDLQVETIPVSNITDMVNHPKHYTQGSIECIDVIEEITKPLDKFEAYLVGTILKYLWRFKFKNGLEDLKKARWYLDKLISKMEGEENGC